MTAEQKNKEKLYAPDYKALEKLEHEALGEAITKEEVAAVFTKLAKKHRKLLSQAEKLTSIGDKAQKKLLRANETILAKEKEITEMLEKTLVGSMKLLLEVLQNLYPKAVVKTGDIKQTVAGICQKLKIRNQWQYEIAAQFSLVGYLHLPPSIVNNVGYLSEAEEEEYKKHPHYGFNMVSKLPRMETYAAIIRDQGRPCKDFPEKEKIDQYPPEQLGAMLLKVVVDYIEMVEKRGANTRIIQIMRKRPDIYHHSIVAGLTKYLNL